MWAFLIIYIKSQKFFGKLVESVVIKIDNQLKST